MSFQYLIDKIKGAPYEEFPFRHVHINNFFTDRHLSEILATVEVAIPPVHSDEQLFAALFDQSYKIIEFPGCIVDRNIYIKWHRTKSTKEHFTNTSCEGFGVTLRLSQPRSPIIQELAAFMSSTDFQYALAGKFGLETSKVSYDTGIQKYLDGYEISPHPDTRNKALTYMVNINPAPDSERNDHHTHYLRFRNEYRYIRSYWDGHPEHDRCWVPWSWCESCKVQRENNSIVIFSPNNGTMHAVKASYNHLGAQRTQMYGNHWCLEKQTDCGPEWEDFVVKAHVPPVPLKSKITAFVPSQVKDLIKGKKVQDAHVVPGEFWITDQTPKSGTRGRR